MVDHARTVDSPWRMLEGRNTPSCVAAILFGVAFAGEWVRGRCFGVYTWQGIAAAWRHSLFFFSVEVLACLYRQRDQLGNSREGLVCLFRSPRCHAESILIVARVFAVSISYETLISKQPGPGWFFSLHACTWAGGLYGVCWDSNSNSIHMQQIRMAIRFNPLANRPACALREPIFTKTWDFQHGWVAGV
jgi:hypothetical protein